MNYLVMECHPGYVILLGEDGSFLKAADFHYQVGQIITHPVPLRKTPVTLLTSSFGKAAAGIAACIVLLFGIFYYRYFLFPYTSIYLSINPQVQLCLNRQGTVVDVRGLNEDGVRLLENYQAGGKDKITVADELIDRAIDMGFLSEGGTVSFDIDTPDQALFEQYEVELQQVTQYVEQRLTVVIEISGWEEEASSQTSSFDTTLPSEPSSEGSAITSSPSVPKKDWDDCDDDDDDDDDDEDDDDDDEDDDDDDDKKDKKR